MASAIENAFNKARRVPNMILSAHANNYQRIDVELRQRLVVPFFIVGTGGYPHLKNLPRAGAGSKPPAHPKAGKATLMAGFDDRFGFVTFEVSGNEIKGRYMGLGKDASGAAPSAADEFTYSAKPIVLGDGQTISLSDGTTTARQ